ncbi:MAG: CoA ester lyase [Anaerolinea sp.]|nr:CoA ester lyase [Anaerolinea sp.]
MRVRRALLFMPGDSRPKIEKGAALGVDSIIMDLEDGVALNNKPAARASIAAALREVEFGSTERLVRINPVGGEFYADDLMATVAARPDGYVLPKVESAQQIEIVSEWLFQAEAEYGFPQGSIALLPIVESARGIVNLREIAGADPRVAALIFGAEDFAGDVGAIRTSEGKEVLYARSAVVTHAKAFNVQAVDTVYLKLDDTPGLIAETRFCLELGFTGKLAIHPRQVAPMQAVFTPTPDEVAAARRLIEAHEAHQAAGTGAFALDGKMVDMPIIRAAQSVLARAEAATRS